MSRLTLVRTPRPSVAPMLATSLPASTPPPSGAAWTFEPKYDGIRIVAVIDGATAQVALFSRNGIDKRAQFPEIAAALARLPATIADELREPIVLDGEIVALDAKGEPARFQALQGRMHARRQVDRRRAHIRSAFIAFDCLADGTGVGGIGDVPLTHLPWRHRRKRLEGLLRRATRRAAGDGVSDVVRLGETSADGETMLARARAQGWEGLIAKRVGAPYRAGERSRDWLKLKLEGRQEFVIGGWTDPERSRPGFGALLLGMYDADGTLRSVGRVGTGFTHAQLRALHRRLQSLHRDSSPFAAEPSRASGGVHWVEPTLVAEVKFTEWTADGQLRHPSFVGLRDDKPARAVAREARTTSAAEPRRSRGDVLGPAPLRVLTRLNELEDTASGSGALTLPTGEVLSLTHLSRIVAPASDAANAGVTKGALLRYYARVAPVLLPAIADRPLVLERHHATTRFHQQHAPARVPDGVRVARLGADEKPRFVAGHPSTNPGQALATLLYLVQLGAVSIDPWHARVGSLETPDYTIVDLDPGAGVAFGTVVDCARWVRDELDALGLLGVPKTSGASGMHVVIPLPQGVSWETARLLAELIATRVARRHPARATVTRTVSARPPGSIYVDFLQNVRGKSVAAVYGARHAADATVSTPLAWEEVRPGLDPRDFTIATVPQRLMDVGDLWADAMRRGNTLAALLAATTRGDGTSRSRGDA